MKLLFVALACFAAGYWIVAQLFDKKKSGDARPDADQGARRAPPGAVVDEGRVTLSNWYRVLDVRETATREEIAAAYKRKIAQYHPDKVAQMGAEIRELAESKSKQINAAYDMGMRLFQ